MRFEEKWRTLAIICAGIFISTLDGSILTIANPIIADSLQVTVAKIQWVTTAYMLVITATLLMFGKIGDQFGSQKFFAAGFLIFSIGSFFCSISPGLSLLISSRIFQAFGSSMMMATGMGIISNSFSAGEKGKALGLTSSVVGIGNMVGPILGGLLLAHFGWHSIFLVNVPIGCMGFYLAWRYLPSQSMDKTSQPFDITGIALFAAGIVVMLLALSLGSGISVPGLAVGFLLLIVFYRYEQKLPYPLLDFGLLRIKIFLFGNMMSFIAQASQIWVMFLIPFYLVTILQYSPATVGIFMTIPPICLALTAPLAGSLSDKIGSGRLTSVGLFSITLAHVILSTLGSGDSPLKIVFSLILTGTGMGCFGSPNSSSIFAAIPQEKAGYTGGFTATVRNLALSLGIAVSASLFNLILIHQHGDFNLGYISAMSYVYRISALLASSGLVLSLITSRHYLPRKKSNQVNL